jgi:hypothetical protein
MFFVITFLMAVHFEINSCSLALAYSNVKLKVGISE